jgi:hypothetical protein
MTRLSSTSMSTRTQANTHKRISGEIRTMLHLCEKSELIDARQYGQLKRRAREALETAPLYLGYGFCTDHAHKPFEKYGLSKSLSYRQKREVLGLECAMPITDERILKFNEWLERTAHERRANWWTFRVGEAARYYHDKGWYPFFITLTVDPKKIDPAKLWQEDNAWKWYITKLARVAARSMGHPLQDISNRDYVAHYGTLEHGKSGIHHHAHILAWFRSIPEHWKLDPNRNRPPELATIRSCRGAESLWPWSAYGQSPFMHYWHADCIWQRLGHKIPVDEKTGKGIRLIGPEYAGNYCGKYMAKEKKAWFHKPKATHGLGLERLTRHLKQMTTKELIQVARFKEPDLSHLVKTMISVPDGLLRFEAKREIYYRTFQKMPSSELIEQRPKPYVPMQRSVQDGANPHRMRTEEFSRWLRAVLPDEVNEYCEATCLSAYEKLATSFAYNRKHVRTIGAMRTK